ncbi:ABC transporter substrate-binding protein [Actinotalea sp.]|uniref:ABC transporter substrate-binding protein n=1 Tax=Actinotalea sp. TaxID=1872145 RepID=UPI0035622BE0
MRRAGALVAALTAVGFLVGCGSSSTTTAAPATSSPAAVETTPADPTTIRIASLKGPTTMGLVGLMQDAEAGTAAEDYQVEVYGTPDEVVPLVVQGNVDIALVPANLAAVLYARTLTDDGAQVQVAAINTLGMLEVVEAGETVGSIEDLRGRTIYSTGKGASPEFVLDFLLARNGIDPDTDVTVEFKSEATEVTALLASEPGAIGVLPQPYVTIVKSQNPDVRTALSLAEEWEEVAPESTMVTGVVIVRTAFATEHPEAFAQFLTDYEASTAFTNEHPEEAAPLIVAAGIVPAAPIAEAAIPACHITFIAGAEMKGDLGGYLQVLFDAEPASVGGSLPGDDFYHGG